MLFRWNLILRLLQCTIKMFAWYLISRKQIIHEIREINPTQNLRLLQQALLNLKLGMCCI